MRNIYEKLRKATHTAAVHVEVGVKINARRHNTFLVGRSKKCVGGSGRSSYFGARCQEKNRNLERRGKTWLGDNLENLSVLMLG